MVTPAKFQSGHHIEWIKFEMESLSLYSDLSTWFLNIHNNKAMTPEKFIANHIAEIRKADIDASNLPEIQKEYMKEYIDGTKELFVNNDGNKASAHFAKLIGILLSQR